VTSSERHPPGLYVLFFTEMWERLSYYGMRALLVLFMVEQAQKGGLGLNDKVAAAIYGIYTAGVYLSALPGGWVADRLLGAQRSIGIGGVIIAAGHFTLAVPRIETFFLGLLFIVIGTGLLKPNISALVGQLYPGGGARRDAGFTIFYMGINLGALLGPLVCSWLGEHFNWHYGFVAAGVGMVLGLAQFNAMRRRLGEAGRAPGHRSETSRREWMLVSVAGASLVILVLLAMTRAIVLDPVSLATAGAFVIAGIAVAYFAWAFLFGRLDSTETKRVVVIAILFLASALFWAGYEQAGSSLNLFAERHTSRVIELLKVELPAGWFQSVPALFVIVFAPVVAMMWVALARRGIAPSLPAKFAFALMLLALGFLVVAIGSKRALSTGQVWPTWLIATYLFHVWGELLLSPVGLSVVTKLAPARLVGQMMGVWFLAVSLGNLLAGLFAGEVSGDNAAAMPSRFMQLVMFSGGLGLLLLLCAKPIRNLMKGVE
jgi:POT family proton-dependent oligopeptide transporter